MPESIGALTEAVFYILISLFSPMHGYGIMQNVGALSCGRVTLGAGTLYGALNTLVEKGWIVPFVDNDDTRKKKYMITKAGKAAVFAEIARLEELLQNGRHIVGSEDK